MCAAGPPNAVSPSRRNSSVIVSGRSISQVLLRCGRQSQFPAGGAFCTKLYVMNFRLTARPRPLAPVVALLAILLMALAAADCAATAEPLATPTPAPELKFEIETEEAGPSRTNVILVVTNIGLTDVLLETSLTLPENAGSDRDYSPTTRAKITNAGGREVGGRAPEVKTLTWVPERLRAGVTLRWESALRCLVHEPIRVSARITSVEVGNVSEAHFDDLTKEAEVTCLPPRRPGS